MRGKRTREIMNKLLLRLAGVVLFLNINGCANRYDIEEYINKVTKEEAFNKKQESGDYVFKCRYKPAELLAIEELMKGAELNKKVTKEAFDKEFLKFDKAMYFDFTIALKDNNSVLKRNVTNQEQYTRFLSELTYNMGRDVCVVADEKDTIRPITYNYSNNYGMAPDIRLLFAFSKEQACNSTNLEFNYSDKLLGINDKINFNYQTRLLFQENNLKFN